MHNRTDSLDSCEWDPEKARANFRKHGVRFVDALSVLEDELAWTIRDDRDGESRLVTLGMDSLARILVVVHVRREARVRLVSARKATAAERARYLAGRGKGRSR